MKIHFSHEVNHMKGKKVYLCTYFYHDDNITPFNMTSGSNRGHRSSVIPPYENTTFHDSWHFIPYNNFKLPRGYGYIELTFDVAIEDGNGNQLDRDINNSFNLTEN